MAVASAGRAAESKFLPVVSQFQEGLRLGADVIKSTFCGHMLPSSPEAFRGWAGIKAIEMGEEAASPEGRGRWKPDLLSGKLRFQYDASHLYIALQVQTKATATVCFKLAFCPCDDEADLTPNHIIYFYLPADPARPGPWNARVDGLTKPGGRIGFQELPAGAGYTIEVQAPLAAIRKGWMPTPGRRLPISIQLDECERSLYSHWLPQETCDPSRPTTWGALEFMAGPTGPTTGKSKP